MTTRPSWQQVWVVGQQLNTANLRVGDAERERAAQALNEHYASGRLDREEYDARLDRIFSAKVGSDLSAVFRDLPGPSHTMAPRLPRELQRRPRRRSRVPFLPALLVLIGLAVLLNAGWIIWVGLGVLLLARGGVCGSRGHTGHSRGSARPVSGSWA